MKRKAILALALMIGAYSVKAADAHWTNTSSEGVAYWDDTANWDNYSAGGNWVFHRDHLNGNPVAVTFTNAFSIVNGMWIENNLDGLVTFKASSLDYGFENGGNNLNVGTGAYGALTIDGGTYHIHNDVKVPNTANGKGVLTLKSGRVETEYYLPIARESGSEGTVYITGGEMIIGYRNGAEADAGRIQIGTGSNSTGALIQCGGVLRSRDNPSMELGSGANSSATYIISNGVYTAYTKITFGNASGAQSLFRVAGGEVQLHDGGFVVDGGTSSTSIVEVVGGTLSVTNRAAGGYFDLCNIEGATAIVNVDNGEFNTAFIHLCCNKNTTCEMNVDGGTVSMTGHNHTVQNQHIRVGGAWNTATDVAGSKASYAQSGGTVSVQDFLVADGLNSSGTATISGGELTVTDTCGIANGSGSTAEVNLDGGVLTTKGFTFGSGTGSLSFNGTEVVASASNSDFIPANENLSVSVGANGAAINTQGYALTVNAALQSGVEEGEKDGGLAKLGCGRLTLAADNTYNGLTDVREGLLAVTNGYDFAGGIRIGSHGAIAVDMTAAVDTENIGVNETLVVFKTPTAPIFEYEGDTLNESVFLSGPVFGYTLSYDDEQGAVVATVTDIDNIASTRKIHSFIAGSDGNWIDQNASWDDSATPGTYDTIVFCEDALMFIYSGHNSPCETMALRGAVAEVRTSNQHPNLCRERIIGHGTLKLEHVGLQSQYDKDMTVSENVNVEFSYDGVGETDTWVKGDGTGTVYVNGTVYVTNGLMNVYEHAEFNGNIVFGENGSLYGNAFNSDTVINGDVVIASGYIADYSTIAAWPISSSSKIVLDGGDMLVTSDNFFTYKSGTLHLDGSSIKGADVGTEVKFANATIEAEAVDVAVGNTDFNWVATVANGVLTLTAASAIDSSTPNYWIGGAKGKWGIAANWSRGIPQQDASATISSDTTILIDSVPDTGTLVLANGCNVTFVNNGGDKIRVQGITGDGSVIMNGVGLSCISGKTADIDVDVVMLNGAWLGDWEYTGTMNMSGNISGSGQLSIWGKGITYTFAGDNSGFTGNVTMRQDGYNVDFKFLTPESGFSNATDFWYKGSLFLSFAEGTITFGGLRCVARNGGRGINLVAEAATGSGVVMIVGNNNAVVSMTHEGDYPYQAYVYDNGWIEGCDKFTIRKVGTGTFTEDMIGTYNLDCVGGTTTLANDSATVAVTVRDGATLKIAENHTVGSVAFESGAKFTTTVTETTDSETEETVFSAACLTASGAATLAATEISTEGATPDTSATYTVLTAAALSGTAVANIEDPDETDDSSWLAKVNPTSAVLRYGLTRPGFRLHIR